MGVFVYKFSFGPQHPASHGVLVLILYMANEFILFIDVHLGYLHRGTEKLAEFKSVLQCLPYMDRLDYVSVVSNEHVLILCIEYLFLLSLLLRVSLSRLVVLELTRVLNGFLAISCGVMDLGAMSPLLWSFEERDKLLSLFDLICGVRMHVAYISIGGVLDDISLIYDSIYSCLETSIVVCDSFDLLFTNNRIAYLRLRGIALLDWSDIQFMSISGVMLRCVGFCWDLRFVVAYEIYRMLSLNFVFTTLGDSFDRFILRLFEVKQAIFAVKQCISFFVFLCFFWVLCCFLFMFLSGSEDSIESIIYLFYLGWFFCLFLGVSSAMIESPNWLFDYLVGAFCFCCFKYSLFGLFRILVFLFWMQCLMRYLFCVLSLFCDFRDGNSRLFVILFLLIR